jgi:hypothetical protein
MFLRSCSFFFFFFCVAVQHAGCIFYFGEDSRALCGGSIPCIYSPIQTAHPYVPSTSFTPGTYLRCSNTRTLFFFLYAAAESSEKKGLSGDESGNREGPSAGNENDGLQEDERVDPMYVRVWCGVGDAFFPTCLSMLLDIPGI